MTKLLLAMMMQYVIATKAGLVNDVKGLTNVRPTQMVLAGTPVRTGPTGYVELLLTPGAYLRLGPSAEAVLDTVDLTNVALHVNAGEAIIEVVEMSADTPIRVTTGETVIELTDPGIFSFKNGVATVLEGHFQTAGDVKTVYKKGWEVSYSLNYRARKASAAAADSLGSYSEGRSALMARASMDLAPVVRNSGNLPVNAFWFFSPSLGYMTYMPFRSIRSPYGYRYTGFGFSTSVGNGNASNNGGGASSSTPSSSGSSGGSSGGGSSASGGSSSPTFSTPSGGRSSAGDYVGGKTAPVGASQPRP